MRYLTRYGRVFPLTVNWADPFTARYEWSTGMSTSKSGLEQRWALRQRPRLTLQYNAIAAYQVWDRLVGDAISGQNDPFIVPMPTRSVRTTSAVTSTFTVATVPFWLVAGTEIVLVSASEIETATVLSEAGGTVTLTGAVSGTFGSNTKVYQAFSAYCRANLAGDSPVDLAGIFRVQVEVEPGTEIQFAPNPITTTFDTLPVMDFRPNWGERVNTSFQTLRGSFGGRIGKTFHFDLESAARSAQKAEYTFVTDTEAEHYLSFYAEMKGRRGSFFAPSHVRDLTLAADLTSGTSTVLVAGTEFFTAFDQNPVWNHLRAYVDGNEQINPITSMAVQGSDTLVQMRDNWTLTVPVGGRVNWCPLSRFAADTLTMTYETDSKGAVALSTTAIRNIT